MSASSLPRPLLAAGLSVAVVLLAGCGTATGTVDAGSTVTAPAGPTGDVAVPGSSAPGSSSASGSPSGAATESVAPADTSPDVAEPVEPTGLTVTAVRAARHEDHDRVVFELAGSGTPGWRVEYVDSPSAPGSGDVVDVPGTAALQVTLEGVAMPYETGAAEVARGPVPVSGTQHVAGVVYGATFEGAAVAWIGTDGPAPFRVYSLTGPSRVVVEVVDAG